MLIALLAVEDESERTRLERTGLPRSTYHAARRRAYEEGWVHDRYLPDPNAFGFRTARVWLLRPYADRQEELLRRLESRPGTVVLWQAPQSVFAVEVDPGAEGAATGPEVPEELTQERTVLSVALGDRGLPVYFDYEGLVSHLASQPGARAYPRGLDGRPGLSPGKAPVRSPGTWQAAYRLVLLPFNAPLEGRPGHRMGPQGLPRSQRRLLDLGWVHRRVLPDPARIPPFRGRQADEMVFVHGRWKEGEKADLLLRTLTGECRVFPFLFAFNDEALLLAALGQSVPGDGGVPGSSPRRPVLPTLRQCLENIVVTRERVASVTPRVDHRYDRLLSRFGLPEESR